MPKFIHNNISAISHNDLIRLLQALWQNVPSNGVCFGFQAAILPYLLKLQLAKLEQFLKKIALFHSDLSKFSTIYRLTYEDGLQLVLSIFQLYGNLPEGFNADSKDIKKFIKFFKKVAICQSPKQFPELFPIDTVLGQSINLLSPICIPEKLLKAGASSIRSINGMYSQTDLTKLFNLLQTEFINNKINAPLILEISASAHIISLVYIPLTQSWIFIDNNILEILNNKNNGNILLTFKSTTELSKRIFLNYYILYSNLILEANDLLAMRIEIIGFRKVHEQLVQAWINNKTFKKIHRITERVNLLDKTEHSWLLYAVHSQTINMIKVLLDHITNPIILLRAFKYASDYEYEAVLNLFSQSTFFNDILFHHEKIMLLLVDIPITHKLYFSGYRLISIAARQGYLKVLKALINHGIDIHDISDGFPPLYYAIKYNHPAIIEALIAAGADIMQAVQDLPLLLLIAFNGQSNLLYNVANINIHQSFSVRSTQLIAWIEASKMPDKVDVKLLSSMLADIQEISNLSLLHIAILNGDIKTIKSLINQQIKLTPFNNNISVMELAQSLRLTTVTAYLKCYVVYIEAPGNITRKEVLQKLSHMTDIIELDQQLELIRKIDNSRKNSLFQLNELNKLNLDHKLFEQILKKYDQLYLAVNDKMHFLELVKEMKPYIQELKKLYDYSKGRDIKALYEGSFFLPEPEEDNYMPAIIAAHQTSLIAIC